MRLISDVDWAELFESVSLVDARLRAASAFAAMDFPTRNLYRSAIEQLARGSSLHGARHRRSRAGCGAQGSGRCARRGRGGARRRSRLPSDRRGPPRARASDRVPAAGPAADQPLQHPPRHRRLCRRDPARHRGACWPRCCGRLRPGPDPAAGSLCSRWSAFLPATAAATALVDRAITWSFGADDAARSRTHGRRSAIAAHARRSADAADQRGRPPGADRTAGGPSPRRRRRRSHLRAAVGRRRCGQRGDRPATPTCSPWRRARDRASSTAVTDRVPAATASCCCIAAASSTRARASGWAGSASAASCTSSTGCCAAPPTRPSCRSPAEPPRCRRTCATSSRSMPTRGCRGMRRSG